MDAHVLRRNPTQIFPYLYGRHQNTFVNENNLAIFDVHALDLLHYTLLVR